MTTFIQNDHINKANFPENEVIPSWEFLLVEINIFFKATFMSLNVIVKFCPLQNMRKVTWTPSEAIPFLDFAS